MTNNNLERVLDLVDDLLDQFWSLDDAIDWALEQLPIATRDEVVAACVADKIDNYR
jgi:hypothetical protein